MDSKKPHEHPVEALAARLRPTNLLTNNITSPPVFQFLVTDHSTDEPVLQDDMVPDIFTLMWLSIKN